MRFATFLAFAAMGSLAAVAACGSSSSNPDDGSSGGASSGASGGASSSGFGASSGSTSGAPAGCVGLQCQQKKCANGGDTTVSGTVFAPNGTLPLYNAIVYVPNAKLDPLTKGASCDKCGAVSGSPVTTALSDPHGNFILK